MEDQEVKRIASDIVTGLCVKRGQMIGFKENEWLEETISKALFARRPSSPSRERVEVLEEALRDCVAAMHEDNPASGWLEILQKARAALKAPSDG